MKKLLLVFAMIAASVFLAQPATAAEDQVCPDLSTGKLSGGNQTSLTFDDVPDGFLIDYYCVKAGSANQDEGPKIVQVNPNAESVTITHPSGKEISHYSVKFIKDTPDKPDEPDTPDKDKDENGGTADQPAQQDRVLPATGGPPLWVLLIAGPMAAAGLVILRRHQVVGRTSTHGRMQR